MACHCSLCALGRWLQRKGVAAVRVDTGAGNTTFSSTGCSLVVGNLTVHDFGPAGGRGLVACEDIAADSVILQVPASILWTPETALIELLPYDKPLVQRWFQKDPISLLGFHLLLEKIVKGDSSEWAPYLALLPTEFTSLIFRSKADKRALIVHAPRNADSLARKSSKLSTLYRTFVIPLAAKLAIAKPTFHSFLWSYYCVYTRIVHVGDAVGSKLRACGLYGLLNPIPSSNSAESDTAMRKKAKANQQFALIPFFDFFNHSPSVQTSASTIRVTPCSAVSELSISDFEFRVTSHTPFRKGEQVFINYGPHDNYRLLLHYGFVVMRSDFANDVVVLAADELFSLTNPQTDITSAGMANALDDSIEGYSGADVEDIFRDGWEVKKKIFARYNLLHRHSKFELRYREIPLMLRVVLRVMLADSKALQMPAFEQRMWTEERFNDTEIEARALRFLRNYVLRVLTRYEGEGSRCEGKGKAKIGNRSEEKLSAEVRWIIQAEKEILLSIADLCRQLLGALFAQPCI